MATFLKSECGDGKWRPATPEERQRIQCIIAEKERNVVIIRGTWGARLCSALKGFFLRFHGV